MRILRIALWGVLAFLLVPFQILFAAYLANYEALTGQDATPKPPAKPPVYVRGRDEAIKGLLEALGLTGPVTYLRIEARHDSAVEVTSIQLLERDQIGKIETIIRSCKIVAHETVTKDRHLGLMRNIARPACKH